MYDELAARNIIVHDATCPFVAKIHKIAQRAGKEGKILLVAGDASHPEVQGIVGHTRGKVYTFSDLSELIQISTPEIVQSEVVVVAQTTFEVKKWAESTEFIKKLYTNPEIFDTICNATWARQKEAEELSRRCDVMVVIGGRHSSNTQKLVAVASRHARAVAVETAAELEPGMFSGAETVGVTAGASTPSSIIEEVLSSMSAVSYTHLDVYKRQHEAHRRAVRRCLGRGVRAGTGKRDVIRSGVRIRSHPFWCEECLFRFILRGVVAGAAAGLVRDVVHGLAGSRLGRGAVGRLVGRLVGAAVRRILVHSSHLLCR